MVDDSKIQKMDEKEEEDKKEEKEKMDDHEDKKEEDKDKAYIDTLKSIVGAVEKMDKRIEKQFEDIESRIKAMETPTDLPSSPKGTADSEDVGAKTQAPDTYQGTSEQAGLDDSQPEEEVPKDQGDLKMEEKSERVQKASPEHTLTTETPRPAFDVQKAIEDDLNTNPILSDFRKMGLEGRDVIAKKIMKGGYYVPNENQVSLY